jgi:hypothetical protein
MHCKILAMIFTFSLASMIRRIPAHSDAVFRLSGGSYEKPLGSPSMPKITLTGTDSYENISDYFHSLF